MLRVLPVFPFSLETARVHARLWADLAAAGQLIGPYDLTLDASALALGWSVATYKAHESRACLDLLCTLRRSHRSQDLPLADCSHGCRGFVRQAGKPCCLCRRPGTVQLVDPAEVTPVDMHTRKACGRQSGDG